MSIVIEEYISKLDLGPVSEFSHMAVIPIFSQVAGPNYLTLKEAMEQNLLVITELDEDAVVGELRVKNMADIPVLLLDGEEIVGAKQNRMFNTTIMVGEGAEITVPVSCTEKGRWKYKSQRFKDSDLIAARSVRTSKNASVSESLRDIGSYRSNQSDVWEEIHELSTDAEVNSQTHAMKDVYQSQEGDLSDYIKAFPCREGQKGLMVAINGEIAGFEVVSSDEAYKLLHDKIVGSYALDAMLQEKTKPSSNDMAGEAEEFLHEVKKTSESRHKSVGTGFDFRFHGEKLVGSSLIVDDHVIHTTFFNQD